MKIAVECPLRRMCYADCSVYIFRTYIVCEVSSEQLSGGVKRSRPLVWRRELSSVLIFHFLYTPTDSLRATASAPAIGDCNAAAYQRGAAGQQRPSVRSPIVARIQPACGHEQSICSIYCSCLFTLAICLTECFDRISYSTSLVRPAKAVCPHRHVKWSKTNFVKYSLFSLNNIQRQSNIFRAAGEWVSDKVG